MMTPRKVKILFAVGRFSVGGAEKFLVRQFTALNRERFSPSLVTIFDEQKDTFADTVRIDRYFHFRSVFDLLAFIRLWRYVRRERFDVVITHLFTANLLVRIAAIFAGVPVIVSYEHNIYPNKRHWQIFMDRLLAKRTARIIVDSETARVFTAKQENIPMSKFTTMFIPPLLERRAPKYAGAVRNEVGIPDGAPIVLTVSRLVVDKGHRYLIDAAKSVLEKYHDVYFLIVGWGPLEKDLKEQARRLGIGGRVTLPGRMDIQDMLPLATVYADPSVSTDLPVAIMEAMREGKAIIATRVGDVPVFIEDGKTGILAEPEKSDDLARGILKLLADAGLRERLGEEAKKKVAQYSLEAYMRSFERLIEELSA